MNETTYIDENDSNRKLIVTHNSAENTTTVKMEDGNAAQGANPVEFEIDDAILADAKSAAEADNNYGGLSGEDKKDAIINKYIAIVSDVNSKNHPKTDEDKDKIRTKLDGQLGGKAKRSKKSAKKGKKSRGMKGKRGRRSAKKGRK